MNYYIATSLDNAAAHNALRGQLNALGHKITYDWTHHGSVQDTPSLWSLTAHDEANGVLSADVAIFLLPGGRGTHVELGLAIALCPHIYLVAPSEVQNEPRTCIFYHHENVQIFFDVPSLLKEISSRFIP